MIEFLAMGGYARWVWGSFALTALVFIVNVIMADRRYRQAIVRLQMRQAVAARRAGK